MSHGVTAVALSAGRGPWAVQVFKCWCYLGCCCWLQSHLLYLWDRDGIGTQMYGSGTVVGPIYWWERDGHGRVACGNGRARDGITCPVQHSNPHERRKRYPYPIRIRVPINSAWFCHGVSDFVQFTVTQYPQISIHGYISAQLGSRRRLGTVENHGNTEITETVIFIKGRDFAKMPCFLLKCRGFTFFTRIRCF